MGKLRVKPTTYRRKGKLVKRKGYLVRDRGKPGRAPKGKRWYNPQVEMGWGKDMSIEERRTLALDAHGGDYLATARALQALANVTTDAETKRKAGVDARYFYSMHRRYKDA